MLWWQVNILSNAPALPPSLEPDPTVTGVPVALTPAASPSMTLCGTVSGGDARRAAAHQPGAHLCSK